MKIKPTAILFILMLATAITRGANELSNGAMEPGDSAGLPRNWSTFSLGPPAKVWLDQTVRHSGPAVAIQSDISTRSYLRSEPIQVAPGEKIRVGGWVQVQNIPAETGAASLLAEFANADGHGSIQLHRVGIADPAKSGWQRIDDVVTVPAGVAVLRLRIGLAYTSGTCWWDDLSVEPLQPLVARVDLANGVVDVASGELPITILNRDRSKADIKIELDLGSAQTDGLRVSLNGDAFQQASIPASFGSPGTLPIKWRVLGPAGKELFNGDRTATVPPPIVMGPPSPTDGVIEDGPLKISGIVSLAVPASRLRGGWLTTRLLDHRAEIVTSWLSSTPKAGDNAISLSAGPVPVGQYTLESTFTSIGNAPLKISRPWSTIHRSDAEVVLNADGFLVANGKPLWPMGIFNGNAKLDEMAAAGFTVTHAYNATRVVAGEPANDEAALKFLDETERIGLKALFMVPLGYIFDNDWDAVRRRVRMFRNHPALLAWDEEEGIARGDMPADSLVKLRKLLAEEDPNHPLMVGDSRDAIGKITDRTNFFPADQMDLGMWWWYPLPLRKSLNALNGEDAARTDELIQPSFLAPKNTIKPLWIGLQAYKKPESWGRYPTAVEYRAQAYLAIIGGAKGLLWYGGSIPGGVYANPKAGDWDALKAVVSELRDLQPLLVVKPGDAPTILPETAPISVTLRTAGGRTVLIAANRSDKPVDVVIHSPALRGKQITVLQEKRAISPDGPSISDSFSPFAVHVYDIHD